MRYDFDRMPERRGTASLKWDRAPRPSGLDLPEGVSPCRMPILPLWVADMDFPACPEVVRAIRERAEHPVYGYPERTQADYDAFIRWMRERNGWEIRREWILHTPGVVPALNFAVQAFSEPGDAVIIQPPVYGPFRQAVSLNGRVLAENPLVLNGGSWGMDIEGLDHLLAKAARNPSAPRHSLLLLCSPHNPVGRVWTPPELNKLATVCARHGVIVVSDEIHSDLIAPGARFTPMTAGAVLSAPNKTFNIAGIATANVIIPDPDLRDRYRRRVESCGLEVPDLFGLVASRAAYEQGGPWVDALNAHIAAQNAYLVARLAESPIPVGHFALEGTYLAWLDFRALGLDDEHLRALLIEGAGVWLDEGTKFGTGGSGFMRLNLACTRAVLEEALGRILRTLGEFAESRGGAQRGDSI